MVDADGRRVRKEHYNGNTNLFLVDDRNPTGWPQVIQDKTVTSSSSAVSGVWVYGLQRIGGAVGTLITGSVRYYGYDALGSVRFTTDNSTGAVDSEFYYDAYGRVTAYSGTGSTTERFRYTGEEWDAHLGMYYLRARYYAPEYGRFWTMDSYEGNQSDPLSLHKYLYCHANPVMFTDPSGNKSLGEMLAVTWVYTKIFSVKAFAAYQVYDKADTIVNAATLVGSVAAGGSVSIVQLAGLAVDFAPFGKILKRLEEAGEISLKAQSLLKKIYQISGKAEALGDVGALMAIRMKGFKSIGFVPGAKGIDDLVEDASGNLIIVEAKGGKSELARVASGNQQMSKGWIEEKIREFRDAGQDGLADRLREAIRSNPPKVQAMVVKTRTTGPKAFEPDIQLKNWNDIGQIDWSE